MVVRTQTQVAKMIGTTQKTVSNILARPEIKKYLGDERRRMAVSDEQLERLIEFSDLGWSYRQMAAEVRVSRAAIGRYLPPALAKREQEREQAKAAAEAKANGEKPAATAPEPAPTPTLVVKPWSIQGDMLIALDDLGEATERETFTKADRTHDEIASTFAKFRKNDLAEKTGTKRERADVHRITDEGKEQADLIRKERLVTPEPEGYRPEPAAPSTSTSTSTTTATGTSTPHVHAWVVCDCGARKPGA